MRGLLIGVLLFGLTFTQKCEAAISFSLTSTVDSVTLMWTTEDGHGYSDFTIMLDNVQQGDVHLGTEFDTLSTTTSETITGLNSGTEYTIAVRAGGSDIFSDQIYTTPNGTSLNIISRGTDNIKVDWPDPTFTFDQFRLTIMSNDHEDFEPQTETVQKNAKYSKTYSSLQPGRIYIITIVVIAGNSETASSLSAITEPSQVMSLVATTVDTSNITLSWSVNTNSKQDDFVIKYKNTNNPDGPVKEKTKPYKAADTSVTVHIEQLLPGYLYTFEVFAKRSVPNIVPVLSDMVKITQNTVPAAVISLESTKTQSSVTLTWETDTTNTYEDSFRVRYKGTATSTSWSPPQTVNEKTKNIDGLLPGDQYKFEVWARSGTQDSAKQSVTVVLVPDAPTPVWNNGAASETEVIFTWNYDEIEFHAEKFELELRQKGSPDLIQGPIKVPATTSSHQFSQLTPGQSYTVKITTVTYDNVKSDSKEVDGTVRPEINSILTEETSSTESVTISYTEDDGVFDKFQFKINDDFSTTNKRDKNDEKQVLFSGLVPGTLYEVSAKTLSGELESAPEQLRVITNPLPPVLNCTEKSPNRIMLRIEPQGEGDNLASYEFTTTCQSQGEDCEGDPQVCTTEPLQCTKEYTDLTTFKAYTFTSVAVYKNTQAPAGRQTKQSTTVTLTCITETSPPGPVEELKVVDYKPYQVELTWKETQAQNGEVVRHVIKYSAKKAGETHWLESIDIDIQAEESGMYSYTFGSLEEPLKGYNYTFTVYAVNNKGGGERRSVSQYLPTNVLPSWNPDLSETERIPLVGDFSSTTVLLNFKNPFLDGHGKAVTFSVIVATYYKQNEDIVNTWASQIENNPQEPYYAIYMCDNFFGEGDECDIAYRSKRQIEVEETGEITVLIGKNDNCNTGNKDDFCNGPLKPETVYYFKLRGYSEYEGFTDTPYSLPIKTDSGKENNTGVYIGAAVAVVAIIAIIVVVTVIVCIHRKRKSLTGNKMADQNMTPVAIVPIPNEGETSQYDDITDYNMPVDYEQPQLENKGPSGSTFNESMQVSTFNGEDKHVYYNKSEGLYYNSTEPGMVKKTAEKEENKYLMLV